MVTLQNIQNVNPEEIQALANNPLIAQNLKDVFPHPYTRADAETFIGLAAHGAIGKVFAIYEGDNFIGVGSVVPQSDIYRNNGEIGYWLGQPFWGKGMATKAVKLLTDFAFKELKLLRLFAGVFETNNASMKVLEKNGYTLSTVLRSAIVKNGKIMDEYLYTILEQDWRVENE